jgi:glycosyltransferase involved in cell wall biosynthesis
MTDAPLTVLLVHNRYLQRGGEDAVFESEGRLLESLGHRVVRYEADNRSLADMGALQLGLRTVWSFDTHRELTRLARDVRLDVAHVHNTLPLLSPATHHALGAAGVAVVQTLHNYRLFCAPGTLLREGRPCHDCLGRTPPWPGVVHACYRDSRAATAAVAAMLTAHRLLDTWERVDAFIALSEFAKKLFTAAGLPAERIQVKANFVAPDPGAGQHAEDFVLYAGRLSPEKGIRTLLEAWRLVTLEESARGDAEERPLPAGAEPAGGPPPRLVVVGDGPLETEVAAAAAQLPGLSWLGRQSHARVLSLMGQARALVFPSLWYEMFPLVIAEAYARGLPVIGSRIGSTAELIEEGVTGRLFPAGDPAELARTLRWAARSARELDRLGRAARQAYQRRYTAEASGKRLLEIYGTARSARSRRHG